MLWYEPIISSRFIKSVLMRFVVYFELSKPKTIDVRAIELVYRNEPWCRIAFKQYYRIDEIRGAWEIIHRCSDFMVLREPPQLMTSDCDANVSILMKWKWSTWKSNSNPMREVNNCVRKIWWNSIWIFSHCHWHKSFRCTMFVCTWNRSVATYQHPVVNPKHTWNVSTIIAIFTIRSLA